MWLNKKHADVLAAIFADPVRATIVWREVEALFIASGAEISEGMGPE